MTDNPGKVEYDIPGEKEFLAQGNLEKRVTFAPKGGEPIFPPSNGDPKYIRFGEVSYTRLNLLDGKTGHYHSDGREAFGGPQKTLRDKFEGIEIEGKPVPHLRIPAEGEEEALVDPEGNMYTGISHKSIQRRRDTHLEKRGVVYHATNKDDEEGFYLNGVPCGKKRGMSNKSELRKVGEDVYLVQTDKEGYMRVVDIDTGELLFVDGWKQKEPKEPKEPILKKCTSIDFVQIGHEWCALKSHNYEEGGVKKQQQWLRPKSGEVIYEGLDATVGEWFECRKDMGAYVVKTYDEEGKLVVVGRLKSRMHYIRKEDKVIEDRGVKEIDGEIVLELVLEKKNPNPDIEDDDTELVYRREDQTDGFGRPHDMKVEREDNTIKIDGRTSQLFKDRATGEIYWVWFDDGRFAFGKEHWEDRGTIKKWGRDAQGHKVMEYDGKGNPTEKSTYLKHFVDAKKGNRHIVLDSHGNAHFTRGGDGSEQDDELKYHRDIKDFWVLKYDGRARLVAEAEDPVGWIRSLRPFKLARRVGRAITRKGWTLPTYYPYGGGKPSYSVHELKKSLGAPKNAEFVHANDFEDTEVTRSRARDTQQMDLPAADPAKGESTLERELREANESGSAPSQHTGEGMSGAGAMLFDGVDPITGDSAAGNVADDAAKAAPGQPQQAYDASPQDKGQGQESAVAPAEEAAAEEAPEQLPEGAGGEPRQWPDWVTGSSPDRDPGSEGTEGPSDQEGT